MLLALNIGNTNVTFGGYDSAGQRVFASRFYSDSALSSDELVYKLVNMLALYHIQPRDVDAAILASVVPVLTSRMREALEKMTNAPLMEVGPGLKSGVRIRMDNPAQLGGELLCAAVGALQTHKPPLLVMNMDTAATLVAVDAEGSIVGGVILPSPALSLSALVRNTAQLPQIDMELPAKRFFGHQHNGLPAQRYCERQRRGTENRALFKIQQRPQRRRRSDLLAAGEKQKFTDERSALQPIVDCTDGHNVLVAQRPLEFHGQPRDDEHHIRFAHLGVGGAVGIAVLPRDLLHIFLQRGDFDHPVRVYVVAFDFDRLFKHCRLLFLLLLLGQRIGFHRRLQLFVGDMGVNLRGVELFMAEDVLERAHVDIALVIHQRGRRVAQLVRGVF